MISILTNYRMWKLGRWTPPAGIEAMVACDVATNEVRLYLLPPAGAAVRMAIVGPIDRALFRELDSIAGTMLAVYRARAGRDRVEAVARLERDYACVRRARGKAI